MAASQGGEKLVLTDSMPGNADLSTKQYYFVKMTAARQVALCNGATDKPIGVLTNKPDASGKAANVLVVGIARVVAGGTITAGDLIGTDANGKATTLVPGTDTTKYIVGTARQSAVSGDVFEAFVNCANPHRAA